MSFFRVTRGTLFVVLTLQIVLAGIVQQGEEGGALRLVPLLLLPGLPGTGMSLRAGAPIHLEENEDQAPHGAQEHRQEREGVRLECVASAHGKRTSGSGAGIVAANGAELAGHPRTGGEEMHGGVETVDRFFERASGGQGGKIVLEQVLQPR